MPATRQPLGTRQRRWLAIIHNCGGRWSTLHGYTFRGSMRLSIGLTESLATRGLLELKLSEIEEGVPEWEITEEGRIALMRLRVNETMKGA